MLYTFEVEGFLDKSEDEVREFLTENKFNKQELRQAIYTLVNLSKTYRKSWLYESEKNEKLEKKIEDMNKWDDILNGW